MNNISEYNSYRTRVDNRKLCTGQEGVYYFNHAELKLATIRVVRGGRVCPWSIGGSHHNGGAFFDLQQTGGYGRLLQI